MDVEDHGGVVLETGETGAKHHQECETTEPSLTWDQIMLWHAANCRLPHGPLGRFQM